MVDKLSLSAKVWAQNFYQWTNQRSSKSKWTPTKKNQKRVLFAANPSYKNILQLSKKNKGLNFHHFLTFSKNITLDLQVASYSPLSYA